MQVENRELMSMVKAAREAIFIEKLLSPLLENNLIEYRKGKKGYPGRYRFCYIEIGVGKGSAVDKQSNCPTLKQEEKGKTSENVVESVVNSVVESVVQSVADSVAIYRPDQTRPDQEEAIASSTSSAPAAADEAAQRFLSENGNFGTAKGQKCVLVFISICKTPVEGTSTRHTAFLISKRKFTLRNLERRHGLASGLYEGS